VDEKSEQGFAPAKYLFFICRTGAHRTVRPGASQDKHPDMLHQVYQEITDFTICDPFLFASFLPAGSM
jgi:hypothetical protein